MYSQRVHSVLLLSAFSVPIRTGPDPTGATGNLSCELNFNWIAICLPKYFGAGPSSNDRIRHLKAHAEKVAKPSSNGDKVDGRRFVGTVRCSEHIKIDNKLGRVCFSGVCLTCGVYHLFCRGDRHWIGTWMIVL